MATVCIRPSSGRLHGSARRRNSITNRIETKEEVLQSPDPAVVDVSVRIGDDSESGSSGTEQRLNDPKSYKSRRGSNHHGTDDKDHRISRSSRISGDDSGTDRRTRSSNTTEKSSSSRRSSKEVDQGQDKDKISFRRSTSNSDDGSDKDRSSDSYNREKKSSPKSSLSGGSDNQTARKNRSNHDAGEKESSSRHEKERHVSRRSSSSDHDRNDRKIRSNHKDEKESSSIRRSSRRSSNGAGGTDDSNEQHFSRRRSSCGSSNSKIRDSTKDDDENVRYYSRKNSSRMEEAEEFADDVDYGYSEDNDYNDMGYGDGAPSSATRRGSAQDPEQNKPRGQRQRRCSIADITNSAMIQPTSQVTEEDYGYGDVGNTFGSKTADDDVTPVQPSSSTRVRRASLTGSGVGSGNFAIPMTDLDSSSSHHKSRGVVRRTSLVGAIADGVVGAVASVTKSSSSSKEEEQKRILAEKEKAKVAAGRDRRRIAGGSSILDVVGVSTNTPTNTTTSTSSRVSGNYSDRIMAGR